MADSAQLWVLEARMNGGARGRESYQAQTEAWKGSCKHRKHELHKGIHDLWLTLTKY